MSRKIDIVGKKFGRLLVANETGKNNRGYTYECKCDCGKIAYNVVGHDLRNGKKTSCGCKYGDRNRRHGMNGTRPHTIWANMKKRCNNPNSPDFHRYGGRGIGYCEKWESFEGFWEDMKDGYSDKLTLDRIDNNSDYSKVNCRWVTMEVQSNNRRNNKSYEYEGKKYRLKKLANEKGLNPQTLKNRLHNGKALEEALKPVHHWDTLTFEGQTKKISDFAKDYGLTYIQLKKRLMRGWSIERALTQPLRKR